MSDTEVRGLSGLPLEDGVYLTADGCRHVGDGNFVGPQVIELKEGGAVHVGVGVVPGYVP